MCKQPVKQLHYRKTSSGKLLLSKGDYNKLWIGDYKTVSRKMYGVSKVCSPELLEPCKCGIGDLSAGIVSNWTNFSVFSFIMASNYKKVCTMLLFVSKTRTIDSQNFIRLGILVSCEMLLRCLANKIRSIFYEINVHFFSIIKFS